MVETRSGPEGCPARAGRCRSRRRPRGLAQVTRLAATLMACALLVGCSAQSLMINKLAKTLRGSGSVFTSDEDPELVRDSLPFGLKLFEALLGKEPENLDLLLASCSGFAQYAYAFVETDAFALELDDYHESRRLQQRSLKLYERALGYCKRGLEVVEPGIGLRLSLEPEMAAERLGAEEIDLLYWTGAAWGAAISAGADRPDLVAEVPVPRALLERVLKLDEDYGDGLIHEAFIVLESLPKALGGSEEKARHHFERARELTRGTSASAYVALARGVSVANQDREEFIRLLEAALAIDPDASPERRLVNLIAQKRAQILLERVDEYFI